jgi:CBS domain-containing protein
MTAIQAMTLVDKFHLLRSDAGLSEVLQEMNLNGINQLPVIADGEVQGILSRESATTFLGTLQELTRSRP